MSEKIETIFGLFMVIMAILAVSILLVVDAHTVCDKVGAAWDAKGQHYDAVCVKSHIDWKHK